MKKLMLTLAMVALACTTAFAQTKPKSNVTFRLTAMAAPAGTAYSSLTLGWGYTPNAPACPSSGTLANCYLGFNVTITQNGTSVFSSAAGYGAGQNSPSAVSATWTPTSGVPPTRAKDER